MNRTTWIWTLLFLTGGLFLAIRTGMGDMGRAYVESVDGAPRSAYARDMVAGTAELSGPRTVGLWIAALFTLCIFSFLYGDNPFYKVAEAVVIGVSAAYWIVVALWTTLMPNLFGMLFPAWVQSWAMPGLSPVRASDWYWNWIPLILGVMLLWRLSPRGGWLSRWPLAFIIGATAGVRLIGFLDADFLSQIRYSVIPIIVTHTAGGANGGGIEMSVDWWASLKNLVLILGVLACLVYFFFSIEHKGALGRISRIGIWVLMIAFGAMFAYTVMGRIALLAMRMEFLFDDWLWLIDPTHHRVGL